MTNAFVAVVDDVCMLVNEVAVVMLVVIQIVCGGGGWRDCGC